MAQLVALVQDGSEQIVLDAPTQPIELNYQYQDLADPFVSRSPYSFSFKLPMTRTNSKFFSFYYDYNITAGSFDATKKTQIEVYDEGIRIMSGVLELFGADHKSQTFTVSIVEQLGSLFEKIRDLSWQQLFTTQAGAIDTDLDHALSWANIIASWTTTNDITTGGVGAGTIVYPLSDWGQNASNNNDNQGVGIGFTFSTSGNDGLGGTGGFGVLAAKNFKPAVRIQYLIEYIFKYTGFTYNSTFLESEDFKKIYMFLATEHERVLGRTSYGFRVGLGSDVTIPTSSASVFQPLTFTNEATPFFDPDGLINAGVLVAPLTGSYYVTARFIVSTVSPATAGTFTFSCKLTVNGATVTNNQQLTLNNQVDSVADFSFYLDLEAGNTVQVEVAHTNTNEAVVLNATNSTGSSFFNLVQYTTASNFVDVSANFPTFTVDKWLKAILEKFNLIMVSDPDEPTIINIEPWNDYWAVGDKKDYTGKVDADSINIEPSTKYQKKSYLFSDSDESEDFINEWWMHHFKSAYGNYLFENENAFAVGEGKTSDLFQPLRTRKIHTWIQNTGESLIPNVLVPTFWKWHDGSNGSIYLKEFVECKPVLAYYNGLQDIGNGYQFNYGGTMYGTYPYFAEYNTVGVTTSTKSLQWGYSYPDNFNAPFVSGGDTGGTTFRYLFHTYWSKMFNEWYSNESRVMTCKLDLTVLDLYKLRFNDLLYIDGCYWRPISIDNFSLDDRSLANATLLKVIDAPEGRSSSGCNLQVDSFNTDGTVNFIDAETGASATATEECCVINGYEWDGTRSECFTRAGSDSGTSNPNNFGGYPEPMSGFNTQTVAGAILGTIPESFGLSGNVGNTYTIQLYANTSGATAVQAQTNYGQTSFAVPLDSIIYMRYSATVIETGGSAGVLGDASNFTLQASVANTRTSASSRATLRSVGTPTVTNTQADAGVTATLGITNVQSTAGAAASYEVSCTGDVNVMATWLITADITVVQLSGEVTVSQQDIYYNLNPLEIEFGNLTPASEMEFNL
tara:strand:- start:670 stop:3720 length:3051 start_codon:yes stop_codon:yes gene_type:complete